MLATTNSLLLSISWVEVLSREVVLKKLVTYALRLDNGPCGEDLVLKLRFELHGWGMVLDIDIWAK